jgi:hypothetical protein
VPAARRAWQGFVGCLRTAPGALLPSAARCLPCPAFVLGSPQVEELRQQVRILQAVGYGTLEDGHGGGEAGGGGGGSSSGNGGSGPGAPGSLEAMLLAKNRWGGVVGGGPGVPARAACATSRGAAGCLPAKRSQQ